jgi:hypothetical protein
MICPGGRLTRRLGGMLGAFFFSPSEVLVLVAITAVIVFIAMCRRGKK